MRLWPRSLFGRLVLVLIAGLTGAQIAATLLSLHERDQALVYFSDQQWVERDADGVRLMDTLPAAERARVAEILTSPGSPSRSRRNPSERARGICRRMRTRQHSRRNCIACCPVMWCVGICDVHPCRVRNRVRPSISATVPAA